MMDKLVVGSTRVAYSKSSASKTMGVGLVVALLPETTEAEIHVYGIVTDLRMTTKWRPLFYDSEGKEIFDTEIPLYDRVLEKIQYSRILRPVGLTQ